MELYCREGESLDDGLVRLDTLEDGKRPLGGGQPVGGRRWIRGMGVSRDHSYRGVVKAFEVPGAEGVARMGSNGGLLLNKSV